VKKKSLSHGELHELLEQLVDKYNRADFILLDPVSHCNHSLGKPQSHSRFSGEDDAHDGRFTV
jgi:hypothetical protein